MQAKTKLLIIAGPQSSGKTTVLKLLETKYPEANFIQETNQYSLVNKNHLGAAYVTCDIEKQIVSEDIRIIKKIDRNKNLVIMETGIMHMGYVEEICNKKIADRFFQKYISAHKDLEPTVIFIDTNPQISFKRRKKYYLQRIQNIGITKSEEIDEILRKYENKIKKLYPYWLKYFKKVPFKKIMIKNSQKSYNKFMREIEKKVTDILNHA